MAGKPTPELSDQPLVSLITVNWNGVGYLDGLFLTLRNISYSNVEIILVDNASTDESVAFTRDNFPEVKIVQNEQNYMFARGNNEGIRVARGEIICLINNDVTVDPGFIEPAVEAFRRHPRLGVCQPKVLDMNRPDYFEYAGAAGGFLDRYGFPFMRGRLFFDLEEDRGQYDTNTAVFWASGSCLFIRRTALNETGTLDEDFILHMEEIDLCWRMHLLGWQVGCVADSRIWHKGGGTLSAENPRKMYWNYRNNIFLLVKNLTRVILIRILVARFFMDAAALLGELLKGKPASAVSIIRAYTWVLLHLRLLWRKRKQIQQLRRVSDTDVFKLVYPGSIVWEYFIRRRRNFSKLKRINLLRMDRL